MPKVTPVYRLPYILQGERLTEAVERTRWLAIDRQLEAIFTFMGDGVIAGWDLTVTPNVKNSVTLSPGSGVINSVAASTSANVKISNLTSGDSFGNVVNYIYARLLGTTPYTAQAEFTSSTIIVETRDYLLLGTATVDSSGNVISIDISEASGRQELSLIRFVLSLISQHVHTGQPGEPDKIDLQNHVKGVLSAANIEDIDASKITSGVIDAQRLRISHNDLIDRGTLTHEELDSLIEKLQNVNKMLFGDVLTTNVIQFVLSLKHVWNNIDEYFQNFAVVIPGIANSTEFSTNSFIDVNATNADIDYVNHRIRGRALPSEELGFFSINTSAEFNLGEYDPNYIVIVDSNSAYGYGYGYGAGLDYFDVFSTTSTSLIGDFNLDIGWTGSEIGYGVSDIFGNDFESSLSNQYGYGYGWEYGLGFPNTLTSTIVTLNPRSSNFVLHDKNIPEGTSGNSYDSAISSTHSGTVGKDIYYPRATSITRNEFLIQLGQSSDTFNRRSTTINSGSLLSSTSNLHAFMSYVTTVGSGVSTDNEHGSSYVVWSNKIDMTDENLISIRFAQDLKNYPTESFNDEWTFDISMDLLIEMTVDSNRYYYRYKGPSGGTSYRFLDKTIKYFQIEGSDIIGNTPTFTLSAEIIESNLEFLTGYDTTTGSTVSVPVFADAVANVSGVILYSSYSDGLEFGDIAKQIIWPQGRRLGNLTIPETMSEDTGMSVDIDEITISGSVGYSQNPNKNRIENLVIEFPSAIDFTSISWIASEPDDSIVYIQVKKEGESTYRSTPIYTNALTRALSETGVGGIFAGLEEANFSISGNDLPIDFVNSTGISLRITLMPSTNGLVAPSLNSININYKSKTIPGQIVVSDEDEWSAARSVTPNLKLSSDGVVSINLPGSEDSTGRIGSVVYGTNGAVVEYNSSWNRSIKRYTGSNLPKTARQILEGKSSLFEGYITDIKKLKNGNIIILDRDASRLIEVDQNYNVQSIVASEQVYLDAGEVDGSETGSFIRAIYNRELGDNGILYLVFSHELKAWSQWKLTGSLVGVDPTKILLKLRGRSLDLSESTSIYPVDRGIIAFEISSEISAFIESTQNSIIQVTLDSDAPSVLFLTETLPVEEGAVFKSIEKYGTKGSYSGANFVYVPIQGIVAFDADENNNYVVLKATKPYSWDTTLTEPWYVRFNPSIVWKSWTNTDHDSYLETNANFPTNDPSVPTNPNYFLNNIYGHRGSIERNGDYLLITICGDKRVLVFLKDEDTGNFGSPTSVTLPSDLTYPMSARFDPKTFTDTDYENIYIALSDLRRGFTDSTGKSRVIKVVQRDNGNTDILWEWGAAEYTTRPTRAVSVNDVRPLEDVDNNYNEGIIVST